MIQFDGVIEMSNAVGGVPVCVAGDINDPYTGLNVKAGQNTLQGAQALAFLRTRHGVGDGSDLGRISNQQVFLSSLVRTIKSADTLANPIKVYALAKAAASNMSLSESLNNPTTIASMAIAMKGIDLNKVVFVQYPNHYVADGVAPTEDAATALMTALQNDQPVVVTGDTGVGSVTDPNAPASGDCAAAAGGDARADLRRQLGFGQRFRLRRGRPAERCARPDRGPVHLLQAVLRLTFSLRGAVSAESRLRPGGLGADGDTRPECGRRPGSVDSCEPVSDRHGRAVRAADGASLENWWAEMSRGFESHALRL